MQVSPNVRAVQVPEANPMHPQFTTIYLIGRDQVLTIDSGADEERYRWMLRGYLAATEKTEIAQAALTHFHVDHSSNLRWLCEEFHAAAHISPATAERMRPEHLPESGVSMVGGNQELSIGGGVRLRVLNTPGHSPDSLCYYMEDEGVLFTGDTILGGATTTVLDLADYMSSLSLLQGLPNLRVICPGHGPLIQAPGDYIAEYISHRQAREQQILEVLSQTADALTSWQIMERIYTEIDSRLRRAAERNVLSHLQKLEKEGRLKVHHGKPRVPSAEQRSQAEAEEREHNEVLRKADEYREQARRRRLVLQENPPTEEWLEPPRFELA
jgi:ribonuclease/clavin/mitogillin